MLPTENSLQRLRSAFNGNPEKLIPAVGWMFQIKYNAERLIKNPIPGDTDGCNAAPIFRVAK